VKTTFLEFEQPIAELETKIEELRYVQDDSAADISDEIQRLTKRSQSLTKDIYGKLTPWQVSQVARHPQRPFTLDYIQALFTHFEELHGDRSYSRTLDLRPGALRGHGLRGHRPPEGPRHQEKILRNFGMPKPGYRKALRLMKLAEKFELPVFTFVDTPGAYPASTPRSAAVRGDRRNVRDGAAARADHRHRHRRGRPGGARHRGRRRGAMMRTLPAR
jgi:acetyl-CoA carboxylase carboxyl transferase subunit alpha